MKKHRAVLAFLGVAAAVAAGQAAAQDSGIYLGGSAGYAQYKDSCKRALVPCDAEDGAFRGYAGYQFSRNWGVELGYAKFGKAEGSGALGSFQVESTAWDLTALGSFTVAGPLSAFGRFGMYRGRTTVDQQGPAFGTLHAGGTNSGFSYGAGLEFRLGALGVRAEWQRYENVGTGGTGEDDIDVLSIGALIRF